MIFFCYFWESCNFALRVVVFFLNKKKGGFVPQCVFVCGWAGTKFFN
ncbi:hypothetical protein, unlikely [Trypanosoma brucei brucei TREU927]|uniref:Uncharacterized protein n=2 Tax=Trypanosoma brucei TaxID=5691 RepID=Q38F05_TRYB2|nr:hypothetical protein, unlikely [Trypanosoma brucei brucei TREU927]EAN76615.1 hypothetical protein, unlikely [Trypanosoma brucei brucei TREU927]